jgi:transcriptional regulator with XRE-family HTH domain
MSDLKKLGDFVRKARETKGLTTRQFSMRVGRTPSAVSQLENGLFNPSDDLLHDVAKQLDINEDVLFAMNGKATERLRAIIAKRPKLISQLLTEIEHAPDNAVLKVIRTIRDGRW